MQEEGCCGEGWSPNCIISDSSTLVCWEDAYLHKVLRTIPTLQALLSPSRIWRQEPGLPSASLTLQGCFSLSTFQLAAPFFWKAFSQILAHQVPLLIYVSASKYHFLQEDISYHPTKLTLPPAYSVFTSLFLSSQHLSPSGIIFFTSFIFCFHTENFKTVYLFCSCPVSAPVPGTQEALGNVYVTMSTKRKHVY